LLNIVLLFLLIFNPDKKVKIECRKKPAKSCEAPVSSKGNLLKLDKKVKIGD